MSAGRRPRRSRTAAIGGVLHDLLQQRGVAERLREYKAWQIWNDVVGPQIAARAQPCRIRDGVLEVRVDQAVWMQQLQLLKPKILSRLNERLGGPIFADMFLRRGRPEPPPPRRESRAPLPPLAPADAERIESILKDLVDPELRAHLRRLLQRQARLASARKAQPDSP